MTAEPAPDPQRQALEDLLVACLDAADTEGPASVHRLLEAHPEHATDVQRLLGHIEGLGLVDASSDPAGTQRLGPFRLLRRLGAGGMGVVYLACQDTLDRVVALKVLAPGTATSPAARERFRREFRAIAKLRHPHLVSVFDAGEHDGQLYYAMEYVPGRSLSSVLANERPIDLPRILGWTHDVACALHAAHEAGIVHRDVKPSNILIDDRGRAMLIDFGLARDADEPSVTLSGSFQGSPHYAAPEQVASDRGAIAPATDVYGLGVTLFEAITGSVPFDGGTATEVFHAILHCEVPRLRALVTSAPRDVELVVGQCLERDPARRYATAAELAEDLDAARSLRPVRARPPTPFERARRAVRLHPRRALATAGVALALIAVAVGLETRAYYDAEARGERARDTLIAARDVLARSREQRGADLARMRELDARQHGMEQSFHEPEQWQALDAERADVRARLETLTRTFARAAEALALAAELAPGDPEVEDARVELALERYRVAVATSEVVSAGYFRAETERLDREGRYAAALRGLTEVSIRISPPGASVHVFRYVPRDTVVRGAEPRLVAVPFAGESRVAAGTWALRPIDPHPPIEPADRIVSVAGEPVEGTVWVAASGHAEITPMDCVVALDGAPVTSLQPLEAVDPASVAPNSLTLRRGARSFDVQITDWGEAGLAFANARGLARRGRVPVGVCRAGQLVEVDLGEGLETRTTASPLFESSASHAGPSPVVLSLEAGTYVAVARDAEGRSLRLPFDVVAGTPVRIASTLPETAPPWPGFVPVVAARSGPDRVAPFWMLDHEVTMAEYLEFLNSEESRVAIRQADGPVRYPRDSSKTGSWLPVRKRQFYLPWHYPPETPVVGVSLKDAQSYAAWLTARPVDSAPATGWTLRVPTQTEIDAVRLVTLVHRPYVAGATHRPAWVKSFHSRSELGLEPVFRYPIDEYPHGVFGLAGSAFEWTRSESEHFPGANVLCGGCWNNSTLPFFRSDHTFVDDPERASPAFGFRLVARRDGELEKR